MRLRLLPAAVRDLEQLRATIARDNPSAAEAVAVRLRKTFLLLLLRPGLGRPTHRIDVREWSVTGLPYVIPYRIKNDALEILRVFHTRRRRPDEW